MVAIQAIVWPSFEKHYGASEEEYRAVVGSLPDDPKNLGTLLFMSLLIFSPEERLDLVIAFNK
jgi:hypothetical protein